MASKERGTDVIRFKRTYSTALQEKFPEQLNISLNKKYDLRYGENPNQPAALYSVVSGELSNLTDIRLVKSGKEGLSATNIMDMMRAFDMLKFFNTPAVAMVYTLERCFGHF